jgi:dipeptidyl aminopeptidase/acylaminoacyl peptidase
MLRRSRRIGRAVSVLLLSAACAAAFAQAPDWQAYLKRDAIEGIRISPNGEHLALAERTATGSVVTIRNRRSLEVELQFDPGKLGEIAVLRWLDDERLVIGANRADARYQVALVEPQLYIVSRDGRLKERLPANFLATIEGDPDHLLVTNCTNWQSGGCIDDVRKVEIGHTRRLGEKVIAAPDVDSGLIADKHGNVRFALSWNDSSQSRLHVHKGKDGGWTLINDASVSGVDSLPLGMDQDGACAYLATERKQGTSVVERYCLADGSRTQVHVDPVSDPILPIYALDGTVPIGAYYQSTRPRAVLWNATHPDVAIVRQVIQAFPNRVVSVSDASRDRSLVIVHVEGDTDPGSYYLFDRTANRASLLTRARPWLAQVPLPTTREVRLQARDGLPLHGLLTLPAGSPGKDLPMVVVPHGGPYEIQDAWGYDGESAVLASQGFAVLRVNFRGSGGYGRDFVEKGHMQWGRTMQDDVTDATRWAIAQGIAAKDRICIYGASYGGYAALMGAVREPALYRCAAGYAAPYDLAKMYKWGSIRRSDLGMNYLERVLGKDKAVLAANSPSQQAANIRIPVLLAHGKLDARVAVEHSRAMAKALRKQGVDADVVEYPYEGHGLAIEQDETDFYTRLLAFLRTHTAAR